MKQTIKKLLSVLLTLTLLIALAPVFSGRARAAGTVYTTSQSFDSWTKVRGGIFVASSNATYTFAASGTNNFVCVQHGGGTWTGVEDCSVTISGANGNIKVVCKGELKGEFTLSSGNNAWELTWDSDDGITDYTFKEAHVDLTVNVTGVTLSPTSKTLIVGETQQLTKTISPSNATNKDVTWQSSNTGVATVNGYGLVTAVSAGTATITVKTVDGNKTATCAITVNKKQCSISYGTTTVNKTYSDAAFTNSLTNTGNGSVSYLSDNESVATVDGSGKVTIKGVGSGVTITATVSDSTTCNYATKTATYTLNVAKATLRATAAGKNITYGDEAPEYTISYSGWKSGETASNADGFTAPEISCDYAKYDGAGTYDITLSGGEATYYDVSLTNGALTVEKKPVTVSGAASADKTYDGTTAATIDVKNATIDGLVNDDEVTVASATGTFADPNAGEDKIVSITPVLAGAKAGNYTVSTLPTATAKIEQRPVTVKASDQIVEVGDPIKQFDSDACLAVLGGALSGHKLTAVTLVSSDTSEATTSGTITPSDATIKSGSVDMTGNYDITYNPGVLTVTTLMIPAPEGELTMALTYGQKLSDGTVTGTMKDKTGSEVEGTFVFDSPNIRPNASETPANYYATFYPDNTETHVTAHVAVKVTTAKAPLVVTADNKNMAYRSESLPGLTYTVTGLKNGDKADDVLEVTLATPVTKNSPAGKYNITMDTVSLKSENYNTPTFTIGMLTVVKAAQDAPESGDGYTIAGDELTVRDITNERANNETRLEIYVFNEQKDKTGEKATGTVSIEPDKIYRIRWAGSANYEPSPWTTIITGAKVTVTTSPADMGEITGLSGDGLYVFGESATLTATPKDADKYKFVEWQDGSGEKVSGEAEYTFTVTKDVALTAIFAEKDKTVAAKPTVVNELRYSGSEQTGITEALAVNYTWEDGSTLKATGAGTYEATAKLNENCVWSDGTTADLKLAWKIDKVGQDRPVVTVSDTTITLPDDFGRIEYSTNGGRTWSAGAPTSKNMVGTNGTTYYFRYKGDADHEPSPATVVRVNVPPSVTTIGTSALESTGTTLNGTISGTEGVSAVGFRYKRAGASSWMFADVDPDGNTFSADITGLTADTDYVFCAVATHTSGTLTGAEVTFHTPKATPTTTGSIKVEVESETDTDRNVIVSIEAGNDAIASKVGDIPLVDEFGSLPDGFYNVVVRTTDGDYTETRMIEVVDGVAAEAVFNIPVGKLATVVDVATPDTPKVAVDGLNEIITASEKDEAASGAKDVEVRLEVEKKADNAAEGANEIKALDSNKIDTFLDMSLYKTTTTLNPQGEAESVENADIGSSNNKVLEIAIPYTKINKKGLMMYRFHNMIAEILTALTGKPLGGFVDGTYYLDKDAGYIFLYASGFSTYAIGFQDEGGGTGGRTGGGGTGGGGTGGGSGGSGSAPATSPDYSPMIALIGQSIHGTITLEPASPKAGSEVVITVTPDEGYKTDSVIVSDMNGNPIAVTKNDDGTYTFIQPTGGKVWITANIIPEDAPVVVPGILVHRMYNPNSGEHFYTANVGEKDILVTLGWNYEGIAWYAPEKSDAPVFRLYDSNAGDHHYTMNKDERDILIGLGWNDEGIGWYSEESKAVPLFRLFNPYALMAGAHHFTASEIERDILVKSGWVDEGIGWYGL